MSDRTGIYRHGAGWRAYVSRGRGQPALWQHFPAEATFSEMQAWRRDQPKTAREPRGYQGSFKGDAKRYLESVIALPTYKEREREIALWVTEFGMTRRTLITPATIRKVRDRWLTEPRAKDEPPLAAGTVNKRLRALSNLYRVLDGKQAYNPVRDVPEAREPDPEPRALDYATIEAILAELPNQNRAKKGEKRGNVSATKLRLQCLAYCPITAKQLSQVGPVDLDLDGARLRLPARAKGRGSAARWIPLLPEAVGAFRAFEAANLFGTFSRGSLYKAFTVAARKVGVKDARPYDLRHSFGTLAYKATQSLEAVADLLQHRNIATTRRYALAAEQDVTAIRARQMAKHFDSAKKPRN